VKEFGRTYNNLVWTKKR